MGLPNSIDNEVGSMSKNNKNQKLINKKKGRRLSTNKSKNKTYETRGNCHLQKLPLSTIGTEVI
jgi:hypothetical protein